MSSIGGTLSIARTALYANQTAVQVASHNIANAQTEGYSRQRPVLSPNFPQRMPTGWVGTGVLVNDIDRVRDAYLDLSVRRESANASGFGVRRDILLQVEGVLGEPSENGLAATFDAFWSSWSDLANTPDSHTARSLVRQRGEHVAVTLNAFDRRLADIEENAVLDLEARVSALNSAFQRVADLNGRILAAESTGHSANDLRDARDLAIDEASKLADVRVLPRSNGSIALAIGSANLVDGNDARPLELVVTRAPGGRIASAELTTRGSVLDNPGASISGVIDGLADIRATRNQLDSLARQVVSQVNGIHNTAPLGRDFFHQDPGGVTAANIRLSDAIRADAANVLAGVSGTDNSIALALASLREGKFAVTDGNGDPVLDAHGNPVLNSIAGLYGKIVAEVAVKTSDVERAASAADILVSQAQMRRESLSGVSVDEELIQLMRHQQAYAAATKLVTAADEMMQTLLTMI